MSKKWHTQGITPSGLTLPRIVFVSFRRGSKDDAEAIISALKNEGIDGGLLANRASRLHSCRWGLVRPCSQLAKVTMVTSNFAASWLRVKPKLARAFKRAVSKASPLNWGGCESHLMALITRWQKGFRYPSLRQSSLLLVILLVLENQELL
jgi:hypothetical protein